MVSPTVFPYLHIEHSIYVPFPGEVSTKSIPTMAMKAHVKQALTFPISTRINLKQNWYSKLDSKNVSFNHVSLFE